MSYAKSTYPEITFSQWYHFLTIQAYLFYNMPHDSDVTIQIFCLLWWKYSYLTWSFIAESSLLVFQYWNLLSQTLFSLYLHSQWTDFHKLSCAGKPQIRAIYICIGCTKVTTNDWDIRPSVAVKALFANILWMAELVDFTTIEFQTL